ncbi:MAG: T9SS type A sorting domain-containing protein [Ginsengibacter sp.]
MKQFLLLLGFFVFTQTIKAQTSYTWNGSVSTLATDAANWTPNGIPGPLDAVTIVTASNICKLNTNANIASITVSSGIVDLGGYTATVSGPNAIFTSGTVQNGALTVSGATTTTFGSGTVNMNCVVNITSAAVTFRNTSFQRTVNITKTGSSDDRSYGNNIFNGPVTITNAGSGLFLLANNSADQFNGTSTFNNTGSSNLFVSYTGSSNVFGGETTFNNAPSANTGINVSNFSTGTLFKDNIIVKSTNGQGVQFCGGNTTASVTLVSGKTISAGVGVFTAGMLTLKQFTQVGTTSQNITLAGNAVINLVGATFNGALTVSSPNIYTSNSVYNNATILTKTDGTSTNSTVGGNTFNGTLTINYNSSNGNGYWAFGNSTPDIYNGDVYSNNNSLDRIIFGLSSANNQFNGNFIVTQSGSAVGTTMSWYAGSTCVMAAGKTISIGGPGFTSGYLALQGFTQNGSTPINLNTTGTSSIYIGGYSANNPSVIGGSLTLTSPDIYMMGGTFNAPVSLTKTGGISNHNNGYQNIFNSTLAINQQSNSGYFMLGYNSNDLFNGNITVTSTGSGGINLGWLVGTGTPTLAAGKTILVGGAGFSAGNLQLNTFTQLGNAPMSLTFTGTNAVITFAQNSIIGGNLVVNSPSIYFNGCTFNGTVNATKTGDNGNYSLGGNVFNAICSITNSSNGFLILGSGNADTWNKDVIFTNNGSERLLPAYNSTGNQFNGNIFLNTGGSARGIDFCSNTGGGATLAAGKTIQAGVAGLNAGYVILQKFTQLGNIPVNITLNSTATTLQFGPNSTFGGNITSTSPGLIFNGGTFNGIVNSTKTGSSSETSGGNNVFNQAATITNAGSGYLSLASGNPDQFNADATFNNTGSNNIYVAINSSNNIFSGITTFNNTPSANTGIYVSYYSAGTLFKGNIIVNSTNGQGVQFCAGAAASTILAAGKTISVGTGGFSAGTLYLRQFTQIGATPQNLTLTGTGNLAFGPTSAFGGNITSTSFGLFFHGCNFDGIVNATKSGTTNDISIGNNVFNKPTTITNAGSGYLMLGNGNGDQFNAAATFNNTGSGVFYVAFNSADNIFGGVTTFNNTPSANTGIYVSYYSAGTLFNDNIIVNSSNGLGVQFCSGATASTSLASGKTISVGTGGFSAGTLSLKQFTQIGVTPQNIPLTGTGNLAFGPASVFGGNVTSTSPGLFFNGCTFNGTANSVKTGVNNDQSSGNNVFIGAATITNAGSGYLMLGNGNNDQFNAAATFNNTGSSNLFIAFNSSNNTFNKIATFNNIPTGNAGIYVGSYSTGTLFNDNIIVNSTNGQGILFCQGNTTATATLAANKTIKIGTGGFSAGTLYLRQFTQIGATSQNLPLTGTGSLAFGPGSAFGGNVTSTSAGLYFHGCNFDGIVNSTKTGITSDGSIGNNVFNKTTTITNSGSGYLMLGNGNADQFNASATFNNTGSSFFYIAHNSVNNIFGGVTTFNNSPTANTAIYVSNYSAGTLFNDNIIVNSSNGQGVQFCASNTTASATLAAGKTISVGTGFSAGTLLLKQFTQTGATSQNLSLTGTGSLAFGPASAFGGDVTSTSPGLFFSGCTFGGIVNSTKTGTSSDQSQGNNTFNGASTFTNNGTGYLLMTLSSPDVYNSDVTFVKNGGGLIYPNYNNNSTYSGNLTVSSTTLITFGINTGTATLNGTSIQNINSTPGTPVPVFTRLIISNTGGGVTLNSTSINVSNNLVLTSGLLNTTTTNILTMLNGSSVAVGSTSSTSYVNGPMRYQKSGSGSSILNFPIGNSPDCRPIILTVNHSNGVLYTYQARLYNASAVALGYSLPPTVDRVSQVHYYTIDRADASGNNQPIAGLSGNQTIQIFFDNNDVVTDGGSLTIVKNAYTTPTSWINIGGTAGPVFTGSPNLIGSITSTSSPSAFNSFSTFSLADVKGGLNILPTRIVNFVAQLVDKKVELSWMTETEVNNDYFTIEKSRDGVHFEFLQNVNSKTLNGNSDVTLHYNAYDANPLRGFTYYRLKQTNLDGKVKYANIVNVNLRQLQTISVYPNPTTGTISINGLSNSESKIKIEWYDVSGRLQSQQITQVQNGIATLNTQLSSGMYLLRYTTVDGVVHEQKIMIKK